jgi:hypothetical protein
VGAPSANRGITNSVSFAFNPATCGAGQCTTSSIAYVQMIRTFDISTGNYMTPNSEQTARMVTGNATTAFNGWAIDRLTARDWGYYGRNDDGTFSSTLTPGSNTVAAVLRDAPSGWPDGSWFDAVSVPVCIDAGSSCVNRLLGYYYWQFFVGQDGSVGNPLDLVARQWHQDAFDLALAEWNTDAAGLGKNAFPAFSRMP